MAEAFGKGDESSQKQLSDSTKEEANNAFKSEK